MARDTRAGSSHLHFVLYENLRGGVCYNAFLSGFLAAEIKMGIAEIIFVRVPLENLDVKKISHLPSHISCPSTIPHMSVRSYTNFHHRTSAAPLFRTCRRIRQRENQFLPPYWILEQWEDRF